MHHACVMHCSCIASCIGATVPPAATGGGAADALALGHGAERFPADGSNLGMDESAFDESPAQGVKIGEDGGQVRGLAANKPGQNFRIVNRPLTLEPNHIRQAPVRQLARGGDRGESDEPVLRGVADPLDGASASDVAASPASGGARWRRQLRNARLLFPTLHGLRDHVPLLSTR